jgi:hypothetical protein
MPRLSQRIWDRTAGMMVLVAAALMVMAVLPSRTSPVNAQSLPTDPMATCTATIAPWFHTHAVSLNGVVDPANSVTFPNTPNCSFYQWSEQMYLWLTSPAPALYGGGARIFDSPAFYDVSPLDANNNRTFIPHTPGVIRVLGVRTAQVGVHGLPVIVDKTGRMFEVEPAKVAPSGKQLILNQAGRSVEVANATIENGKPVFRDQANKIIAAPKPVVRPEMKKVSNIAQKFIINGHPIFLGPFGAVIDTEEGQADGGVLEAQNGSLVYYATMVNDVYAYFLTGTKDGGILPKPTQFPTSATDLAKITTFASAHGKTFPDPNALAIEVKTAWIEAAGLPNIGNYITMTATVPNYNKSNPNNWVPSGQKTILLAMVGIHVVGSTKGHPEMVWATFEHFGNAPDAPYTYNSTTGPKPGPADPGPWLFSSTNSGPLSNFNVPHMSYNSPDIVAAAGHTISPSNTMRMKPFGAASNASPNPIDGTAAASNTEIISIDRSVLTQMAAGGAASDVRMNYYMTGATWTINGFSPTTNFGNPGNSGITNGKAVGTSQLNNTTMETYQQGNPPFVSVGSNCFLCHSTNTVSVSHMFCTPGAANCSKGLQPLF